MIVRGCLVLAVGLAALLLAGWFALEQGRFLQVAQRAPGEVIALNAGGSHPEIRFPGPGGQMISYPEGGLIWGYRQGMRVEVLYDPADPGRGAVIDDPGAIWGMSIFSGLIGAGLLLGGFWTLWLGWRNSAGRQP